MKCATIHDARFYPLDLWPWADRRFLCREYLAAKSLSPALVKDRSVVFLFMHGGPSQTETFDPKMDQPSGIRSATGEIKTSLPGVTFGSTFPKLARLAHKMAVVRSFTTGTGAHDIKPIVGKNSLNANIGSLYSRVAGPNDPLNGMPKNIALYPRAVNTEALEMTRKFGDFASPGSLGSSYAPFVPGEGGTLQDDMSLLDGSRTPFRSPHATRQYRSITLVSR